MSAEQQAGTRVEMSYRATIEDLREALRARMRATPAGRRTRWLMVVIAVLLLAYAVLSSVLKGTVDVPFMITPVVVLLVMLFVPHLQARQFYRLLDAGGPCRTTVDESGIAVANQQQSSVLTWQALAHYTETPRVFVLFSGDRNATSLTILPKRGAPGAGDIDRLRALFDRHLTRV
ncbi:YcxB family protein [Streptomyces rimosus]|uniref:YcxB family protein n=1 Tax=Streptomyces rimosus TaxID=1927 RepID=UPI00067B5870|nr:YcxB family protein [Streptomyces rimosus]